jgi:hypothetical protein
MLSINKLSASVKVILAVGGETLHQSSVTISGEHPCRLRNLAGSTKLLSIIATLLSIGTLAYSADPISFTLTPMTLSAGPNQTVIFTGQVTNTSGQSLNASDLFFNFSNYDPGSISDISQLLGEPDFTLPNNTFSPAVDLFSVTLASGPSSGTHTIDVSLEGINNDLSSIQTVEIVTNSTVVPEPSTLILGLVGAIATFLLISYVAPHISIWSIGRE